MKKTKYTMMLQKFFITGFILLMSTSSLQAQPHKKLDSLLAKYNADTVPGLALAIIKNGKLVFQKNYGSALLQPQQPVTAASNFRLASVTKQFTAACVLQLIDKKLLHFDNTLYQLFEGFPEWGKKVTLRHLLNHTSGIKDYEDDVADTAMHPQIKDAGVLTLVKKWDSTYFEPGSAYKYSNTAYALLALIVEKKSGLSFGRYLQQNIFKPLKMNQSVAYEEGITKVKNRAWGYAATVSGWQLKDQSSTSAVLGDGGIYSSINDLLKWDAALYTEKILPAAFIEKLFTYTVLTDGTTVPYGMGWHLKNDKNNDPVVYHTGSTSGFRNIIYRIPSKKFTVVALSNRNKPVEENMVILAEKIIDAYEATSK